MKQEIHAAILISFLRISCMCHCKCAGQDSYKWILYGDDDTVFVIDNIIKVLSTLDHTQPYLLSDALWWLENGKSKPTSLLLPFELMKSSTNLKS